jgi:hypothetical protein
MLCGPKRHREGVCNVQGQAQGQGQGSAVTTNHRLFTGALLPVGALLPLLLFLSPDFSSP